MRGIWGATPRRRGLTTRVVEDVYCTQGARGRYTRFLTLVIDWIQSQMHAMISQACSGLFWNFFFLKQISRSFDLSTYYTWFLKWNWAKIKDNLKGWITTYRENEFILALFPLCPISLKKHSFRQRANSVPTWISAAAPRIHDILRMG